MSSVKIWGTSFSLIGDLVMSLPQLSYFKKKYPNPYIYFVIHKKIAYCAPLFFNHPLIDNIRISEEWSDFGPNDYVIAENCDVSTVEIDRNSRTLLKRIPSNEWYNHRNCIEENAMMSGIHDLKNIISEDDLSPKLYKWFDVGLDVPQKKGSYSFCNITLEALNELLRPNMNVKVSRKWAVDLGLVDSNVSAISDQTKKKVNIKVTKFEDDQTTNLDDPKVNLEVKETEW